MLKSPQPVIESSLITRQRLTWAMLALMVAALAPLWWRYFTWSWKDGHYQYFPLLIFAVAVLYRLRLPEAQQRATEPAPWLVVFGLVTTAGCVLVGHVLDSGLLGIVSTILAAWTLTYAIVGGQGLRTMAPVLCLLFLAVPLPLELDKELIFKMQFLASQCASLLLDGAGIMHVREGVILITEKSRYMTEEACSGVRSLFSSLAVVAVHSVVAHHRLARTLTNLVQTVGWVLIGNSVRVAACVILADNVSPWYASGAGHELLSMVVFAFILLMVASTDQLISWFAEKQLRLDWSRDVSSSAERDLLQANVSMLETKRPWLVGGKRRIKVESMGDDRPSRWAKFLHRFGRRRRSTVVIEAMEETASFGPTLRYSLFVVGGLFSVLVILGIFTTLRRQAASSLTLSSHPSLPTLQAGDLPSEVAAWEQAKFDFVEREPNGLLANESSTWTFRNGDLTAVVSVDSPWAEWHNLNMCYASIGWDTQAKYFIAAETSSLWPDLTHSELVMTRDKDQRGLVLFTVVDRNRQDVRGYSWRNGMNDFNAFLKGLTTQVRRTFDPEFSDVRTLPATTIQVFCVKRGEFSGADVGRVREFFFEVRSLLLESPRWKQRVPERSGNIAGGSATSSD